MKVVSKIGWGAVALVLLIAPIVGWTSWLGMESSFLKGALIVPLVVATVYIVAFLPLFVYFRIVRKSNGHK